MSHDELHALLMKFAEHLPAAIATVAVGVWGWRGRMRKVEAKNAEQDRRLDALEAPPVPATAQR